VGNSRVTSLAGWRDLTGLHSVSEGGAGSFRLDSDTYQSLPCSFWGVSIGILTRLRASDTYQSLPCSFWGVSVGVLARVRASDTYQSLPCSFWGFSIGILTRVRASDTYQSLSPALSGSSHSVYWLEYGRLIHISLSLLLFLRGSQSVYWLEYGLLINANLSCSFLI
jgi:hypothetical protein